MNSRLKQPAIFTARFCGLAAFALGCVYASGVHVPLACHILLGALTMLALLCLAALAYKLAPFLALVGVATAILVPLVGLLQDEPTLRSGSARPLLVVCHMCLGLASIALSEKLNGKMKPA